MDKKRNEEIKGVKQRQSKKCLETSKSHSKTQTINKTYCSSLRWQDGYQKQQLNTQPQVSLVKYRPASNKRSSIQNTDRRGTHAMGKRQRQSDNMKCITNRRRDWIMSCASVPSPQTPQELESARKRANEGGAEEPNPLLQRSGPWKRGATNWDRWCQQSGWSCANTWWNKTDDKWRKFWQVCHTTNTICWDTRNRNHHALNRGRDRC